MRLPNNPSVLAEVKFMMNKVPLGTAITLHDLMKAFPTYDTTNLSAALSTLANNRFMEIQNEKVFSAFVDKNGHRRASVLKSYKLVEHPETGLNSKPVFLNRGKEGTPVQTIVEKEIPVKATEKYDRAFALNPHVKWEIEPLLALAKEISYLCDFSVRDEITGTRGKTVYEWSIANRLKTFNPDRDVLVIYGDTLVLAMAVFYLGMKQVKKLKIARFSNRTQKYEVREISVADFVI